MINYLEKKQIQLERKKQKHQLSLDRYSLKLEQKSDPNKEEKLSKRAEKYSKNEDKFWKKAEAQDYANKNRIWEIDLLRAAVIIGMLIDHLFVGFGSLFPKMFNYDQYMAAPFFSNMYSVSSDFIVSLTRISFRFIGVVTLIMLIGINTSFSRNNLKRALILLGIGLGESAFFAFGHHFGVTNLVIMGTITTFALCLLIYIGIEAIFKRFQKAWKWICLGIALTILISFGFVRYNFLREGMDPSYNNFWIIYHGYYKCISYVGDVSELNFVKVIQHIFGITYFGQDYLGLFPYLGYIFLGAFIGQTVYKDKKSILHYFDKEGSMTLNELLNIYTRPVLWFGHHTLWFYLLHTPIYVLIILFIGGLILRIPLSFV